MSVDSQEQTTARLHNQVKAFACRWYARFDRGVTASDLAPYLPEDEVEFLYPGQAPIQQTKALLAYAEASVSAIERSAHHLGELHVRELEDGLYEVLCEHAYQALPKGQSSPVAMQVAARMKVRLGLKTSADPGGKNPKIVAYKVVVLDPAVKEIPPHRALRAGSGAPSPENDAKAFVYDWFSRIDAGDADGLRALMVDQGLDVDLFGNRITDPGALREFLLAQMGQQRWSAHVPLAIDVDATNPLEPDVRFLLRFDGELASGVRLKVSNATSWRLRADGARMRLQRYRLELL